MDELQTHTSPTFQRFGLEEDGYSSGNSFTVSPKELVSSHDEVESSDAVIFPTMMIEATNFKEQLPIIRLRWMDSIMRV